ncbi:hypothetical protein [Escherichia coli]|uniref:hypothetical protein n=1 Tax=Escherichia coli TaxID=562 RepID=UPI00339D10EF
MKNALQFLFVAFWLFVSCMPIIFTARYMEKVDVLILIFGYINALFSGCSWRSCALNTGGKYSERHWFSWIFTVPDKNGLRGNL